MSTTVLAERPPALVLNGPQPGRPVATDRLVHERVRWTVVTIATLATLILWAADNGGYDTVVWLPSALVLTAVSAWTRLVLGRALPASRPARVALALLALYTAWSFLSITWASDKGAALLGSDRTLLYLTLFYLVTQLSWNWRRLQLGLLIYLGGVGIVTAITLARLSFGHGAGLLQDGALASPLGYHNATAALGTIGAGIAIILLGGRHLRPWARITCAAVATVCLEMSLLAASRGWLYTLPVIVVVLVALAPQRGRRIAWAAIPVAATVATLPWILHAYHVAAISTSSVAGERAAAAATAPAARAALVFAVLAALVTFLVDRLDAAFAISARGLRLVRLGAGMVGMSALGAAVVGLIVLLANGSLSRGWHQFTTDAPVSAGVSRFTQLGSGRYDFWRVALDNFLSHPLGGLGQDNFAQVYTAARHTGEQPTWVHSLELRLLVHTGAIGFALFAAFVLIAVRAVVSRRRATAVPGQLLLAAALVPLTVWVIHGSVDWFWEMPALSGPAFVFLAAAVALAPDRLAPVSFRLAVMNRAAAVGRDRWQRLDGAARPRVQRVRAVLPLRVLGLVGPLVVLGAAVIALGPAYLGERDIASARTVSATKPAAALADLRHAASMEPFSYEPALMSTAIQLAADRPAAALTQARVGLQRDSGSWLLWLERGLAAGSDGRADLEQARKLDPREPVIATAIRRAGTAHPLTIVEAEAIFAARNQALIGR
jgi:O-antigen ligase